VKEAEARKSEDEHGNPEVDGEGANADFLLQRGSESELALVTGQVCGEIGTCCQLNLLNCTHQRLYVCGAC